MKEINNIDKSQDFNFKKNYFGGYNKQEVAEYISELIKNENTYKDKIHNRIKSLTNIIKKLIQERNDILEKISNANRTLGQNIELMEKLKAENKNLNEEVEKLKSEISAYHEEKIHSFNKYIDKKKGELTFYKINNSI